MTNNAGHRPVDVARSRQIKNVLIKSVPSAPQLKVDCHQIIRKISASGG
jgi:hypothetical protein